MIVNNMPSIYQSRLQKLRQRMAERYLDVCLISAPENIFYLTGLNHQGYFAFHMLIVPVDGELLLIARAMEASTVVEQVEHVQFAGFPDNQNPAEFVMQQLNDNDFNTTRIGLEKSTLTAQTFEMLQAHFPTSQWVDISDLVFQIRRTQTPDELEHTRKAVAVGSQMMQAALSIAGTGISEREIAAEIYHAMVRSGGEYPGFHPFVRSNPTLHHEHVTWSDRKLEAGDMLFVELAGCSNRYHAPMGRLIYIDSAPQETHTIEKVCLDAFENILDTMKPGVRASEVYRAWQAVVDKAGLTHYRRHHCGYLVGIAFPPSWTGGKAVVGLREGNDFILETGMVFHTMSWLMNSGRGDYFVSDTVIITEDGCEVPTTVSRNLTIKT